MKYMNLFPNFKIYIMNLDNKMSNYWEVIYMKKKELKKRFFAMGMATMMAFASSGMLVLAEPSDEDEVIIENEEEELKELEESKEVEAFNFEDADTELYVGSDWAGANASLTENGTKAVIDASSF